MNAFDRWYAMTDYDFVSKDAARECWNAALDEAIKCINMSIGDADAIEQIESTKA